MIQLTHESRILLGVAPADFRKGMDGFAALCRLQLAQEPADGTVYCFINRARTMIRALSYDGSGYWLMTKRLSKGRFTGWPQGDGLVTSVQARQLRTLLQGEHWQRSVASTASAAAHQSDPVASISVPTLATAEASTTVGSSILY